VRAAPRTRCSRSSTRWVRRTRVTCRIGENSPAVSTSAGLSTSGVHRAAPGCDFVRSDIARVGDGILNRTKDSFYEPAATFDLDALFERADKLVIEGADLLDIGGVKAGPGDEVDEAEELERVVPVVTELVRRFDVPVSVDTWRRRRESGVRRGACIATTSAASR